MSISSFEDYCVVCERQTDSDSLYCSEACRMRDTSSATKIFKQDEVIRRVKQIEEPEEQHQDEQEQQEQRDLSYESPLLSTHCHSAELDNEKLDLNEPCFSLKDLISSTSLNYQKWLLSTTIN